MTQLNIKTKTAFEIESKAVFNKNAPEFLLLGNVCKYAAQ
jgi:hypothetical protein